MIISNIEKTVTSLALLDTSIDADFCIYDCYHSMLLYLISITEEDHFTLLKIEESFKKEYNIKISFLVIEHFLKDIERASLIKSNKDDKNDYLILNRIELNKHKDKILQKREYINSLYDEFINGFIEHSKKQFYLELIKENAENNLTKFLNSIRGQVILSSQHNEVEFTGNNDINHEDKYYACFLDYLIEVINKNKQLKTFLIDFSFGQIITDTIIHGEYSEKLPDFSNLVIYLDSPIIYFLLGFHSIPVKLAYKEHIHYLKKMGARLKVFKHNYIEVYRNLNYALENYLTDHSNASKTLDGCRRYKIYKHQLKEIIEALEEILTSYGIEVEKEESYTAEGDEYEQFKTGFDKYSHAKGNMVDMDIRSLSAIYYLRKSGLNTDLKNASHLMITDNDSLIKISDEYNQHSKTTINPIINITLFAVYIWMSAEEQHRDAIIERKIVADILCKDEISTSLFEKYCQDLIIQSNEGRYTDVDVKILKDSKAIRILKIKTNNNIEYYDSTIPYEIIDNLEKEQLDTLYDIVKDNMKPVEDSITDINTSISEINKSLDDNIDEINKRIDTVNNRLDITGTSLDTTNGKLDNLAKKIDEGFDKDLVNYKKKLKFLILERKKMTKYILFPITLFVFFIAVYFSITEKYHNFSLSKIPSVINWFLSVVSYVISIICGYNIITPSKILFPILLGNYINQIYYIHDCPLSEDDFINEVNHIFTHNGIKHTFKMKELRTFVVD